MNHNHRFLTILLALLFTCGVVAQTTTWKDLHKVKKKETIFGIAKEYGISIQQLLDANPDMKKPGYELKKGDWIFVPYAKDNDKKGQTPTVATSTQNLTTTNSTAKPIPGAIRIGVMLPLHNLDGDGKRMVEYYRGILLALNQLKSEGINTDVHAWNVPKDADIRTTLLDPNVASLNIIFGPLYSNQVKPLADFCRVHGTKLVIPFSIEGSEVTSNPNVFQIYQSEARLNDKAIACFLERFQKTHHPVFINCNDGNSQVGAFTGGLRKQLDAMKVKYDLTNINSSQADFAKHFTSKRPNVIIVNTEKSPQLNQVFVKLDSLKKSHPGVAISMYGYNQWFIYQDYDLAYYFKYNVYIPSTYYYNKVANKTEALEKLYKDTYGEPMSKTYIPRIAITGYDQAQFFIRGLKNQPKNFKGTETEAKYKALQTRLNFERVGQGGYQNCHFQLVHFKVDQTMENLVY